MKTFLLNKVSRKAILASFLLASSVFTTTAMAQTQDGRDFSIDGFAAYEGTPGTNWYRAGGTTGGASGKVVKANTFSKPIFRQKTHMSSLSITTSPQVSSVMSMASIPASCWMTKVDSVVSKPPTASAFWWHPIRPSLESLTQLQAKLLSSPTSPL